MKGAKPSPPVKLRRRSKYPWAAPLMIGVMVMAVHAAFLAFHAVPQARMLFNGDSKDLYPGIKPISQQTFFIEVGLHFFATTMFIICFLRAVFTKPGSVSTDQTPWKNGQFRILPKDEQKFQALLLGPNIDQFAAGQDSQTYLREYVSKNRGYLMAQSLDKSESKLNEQEYWNSWLEFLKNFPVVNRRWPQEKDKEKGVPDGLMRQCIKSPCGNFKPDRSHHCRECNRCVLRMDHHCPWINNCVGFHTYKFFMLMLFYGVMASLTVLIPLVPYVGYDIGETRAVLSAGDILRSFALITTCLICSFISVGCSWFGGHHVYLILQGMTTIEWKESAHAQKDVKVRNHRFAVAHGKFHMSAINNVRHIMGEWYTWLLPIAAQPQDDKHEDGMYLLGRREEDIPMCC